MGFAIPKAMKKKSRKFLVAWIGSIVITGCGVTQSLEEGLVGTFQDGSVIPIGDDVSTTYTFHGNGQYEYLFHDPYGVGDLREHGRWSAADDTLQLDVRSHGTHEGSMRDTTKWVKRLHLEHDSEFDWIIVDQSEKLYRDGKASVFE